VASEQPRPPEALARPRTGSHEPWGLWLTQGTLTRPPPPLASAQAYLIVCCYELMELRMARLHEERQELCQRLAAAAAADADGAGASGHSSSAAAAASVGAGGASDVSSQASDAQAAGRDVAGLCGVTIRSHLWHHHHHQQQEQEQGMEAPCRFDAFTEQSEIADEMAANTRRVGAILQLHMTALYAILTDVQRARLGAVSFPVPANTAKCVKALAHLLRFQPDSLPPASAADLRSEMARWTRIGAAPPRERVIGGDGGGGAGRGAGSSRSEARSGGCV
jgi:hypothetical protein